MKCGKPLREKEQEFCADCAKHSLSFDQGRSLYLHTSMVQRAVYQFKFHNRRYYAEIFAEEMTQNLQGVDQAMGNRRNHPGSAASFKKTGKRI